VTIYRKYKLPVGPVAMTTPSSFSAVVRTYDKASPSAS